MEETYTKPLGTECVWWWYKIPKMQIGVMLLLAIILGTAGGHWFASTFLSKED